MILVPENLDKSKLTQFLQENESKLRMQKKALKTTSDAIFSVPQIQIDKLNIDERKSLMNLENVDKLRLKIVLNTCGIMDSHSDVHIPGIWKKTLKENKSLYHLQSHRTDFNFIISDVEKAYTQEVSYKELGISGEGTTESLIMEATAKKSYNEFMFNQYKQGKIKQHSVGMRYVKITLCINDEGAEANWEAWKKYIPYVINKEMAEAKGYFWAVTEAKLHEGSAILLDSKLNMSILEMKENKNEPSNDTQVIEPPMCTQINQSKFMFNANLY